ncbi:arogenate dehydratase/prephenate dehydratase 1, chloroplastic-like [Helianthus annuus]|uniref:arogenate dehydratase/prephenate dehydratase 1, chloroplastic-like n=1 Tax=Helianthus annuus TaxID=4232 RepID=UPI000B8F9AB5|nr:arogenate dehydratase/prephenate dehydratase 1, chloroplastic-like [Helianthus annuus]
MVNSNEVSDCLNLITQAFDQCKKMLNELNVVKVNTEDTAGAAQIVASKGVRDTGAIASSRAAEIYGLHILSKKLEDYSDNVTRFLILAREPIMPGTDKPYKTSIVFTLEEGLGVLFKALAVFSLRDINLSKEVAQVNDRFPNEELDFNFDYDAATFFKQEELWSSDFETVSAMPNNMWSDVGNYEYPEFITLGGELSDFWNLADSGAENWLSGEPSKSQKTDQY